MLKQMVWSLAVACLIVVGTAPARAGNAELVANVAMEKAALTMEDGVNVRFTLTNRGVDDLLVLKWKTPFAGIEGNLFAVERDGERVAYTGRLVKRAAPRATDYYRVPAGESASVVFDLSAVYDMRKPGNYTVRYEAAGIDVVREDSRKAQTVLGHLDVLESDTAAMTLTGEEIRGGGMGLVPVSAGAGNKALTPTYLNCTNTNITKIGSSLANAQTYATNAYNFLVNLPTASRSTNVRFKTWFGTYTSSHYSTVQTHYLNEKNAFANQTFQLDCDCASDNTVYAFVYANQPYHVHLCGAFFSAPATGTDSKAGTLVHETSHFTVVAGTNDYAYGQSACKSLAISNSNRAVANADSHEYFAENNPALQ